MKPQRGVPMRAFCYLLSSQVPEISAKAKAKSKVLECLNLKLFILACDPGCSELQRFASSPHVVLLCVLHKHAVGNCLSQNRKHL